MSKCFKIEWTLNPCGVFVKVTFFNFVSKFLK